MNDITKSVLEQVEHQRRRGKEVVFTHGAFDLLHRGHVDFLEAASHCGDVLVVGIHRDAEIRAYKGPGRPLLPLEDRLRVVGALRVVHFVLVCADANAVNAVRALRPDVYVKDDQRDVLATVEAKAVMEYGGKVRILPYSLGISTTMLLKRLLRSAGGPTLEQLERPE